MGKRNREAGKMRLLGARKGDGDDGSGSSAKACELKMGLGCGMAMRPDVRRGHHDHPPRPLISLGDALRAVAALRPGDDEARDAILELLGIERRTAAPATPTTGPWKPSSSESVSTAQRQESAGRKSWQVPARAPQRMPSADDRPGIRTHIRDFQPGAGVFEPPGWLAEPGGTILGAGLEAAPPPEPAPLFSRVERRGILSAALATYVAEGDLDVDRIVEILGQARPLEYLPRLASPTLRRGVQLLLDRSPGMDPFAADQRQLVQMLDDILADDRLEVLYFAGCPDRNVGSGPRSEWGPWKRPPPATPVLVVTDLGIGGPPLDDDRAAVAEWLDFARKARGEGNVVIGLVPYEATRWPPALARAMTLLHWSERTTAGEVRHAMRDASRRAGR